MENPPSPDIEIDLPAAVGELGADRLRQRVGHRAVRKEPITRRRPLGVR